MSAVAERAEVVQEAAAPALPAGPVRVIEPWHKGIRHRLGEVRWHWGMIGYYGRSYIKRRYRNTWLGWIWLPLRPAIDTVSKAFIFGGLLSGTYYGKPAIVFMAFGNAGWLLFQRSSYWCGRSMRISRSFVRNAHPPWLPKLIATVIPTLMDFFFAIVIALVALIYYWIVRGELYLVPGKGLLIGLSGYAILIIMGEALGFCLSPFTQFTRDIRYLFAYVMMFWYYVTPIVYTASTLPPQYQPIAKYNPLTAPLQIVSNGFLGTPGPSQTSLLISMIFMIVLVVLGLATVNRYERGAIGRL